MSSMYTTIQEPPERARTAGPPDLGSTLPQDRERKRRPKIWMAIALVLIAAVVFYFVQHARKSSGGSRYITASVQRTTINATIQETGTINPVNQVQVGTQVSGTIQALNVDFNSIVHKGEVLATLDPTSFRASSSQAHANLEAARAQAAASQSTINQNAAAAQNSMANAAQLRANIGAAQANVQKALAQQTLSQATVKRDRSLLAQGFISQSQMDADLATDQSNAQSLQAARSSLEAAQQQATGGSAQVVGAQAQETTSRHQAGASAAQIGVAAAQAQEADYNLDRTVIRSPIDGIVVSRSVSVGQTVAASLQTPTLFVIASSLKDMQVDVSVDEADVGQLKVGQAADITVPAFPNVTFHGTVKQVRVNPTTVSNVVTYDAVVAVHDQAGRLRPGMTANVTIDVVTRKNVLSVPVAALLYRPSAGRSAGGSAGAGGGASAGAAASPQPVAGAPNSNTFLWVVQPERQRPSRVPVTIGYSDGTNVEIKSGDLQESDRVIIGESQSARAGRPGGAGGPGLGGGGFGGGGGGRP
jgi:HlyD family secretion protein